MMTPEQRSRLIALLKVQSESGKTRTMRNHMEKELTEAGMTVVRRGKQLLARKGRSDGHVPVVVAHSDTVHKIVAPEKYGVYYRMSAGSDFEYFALDPTNKETKRGVGGDDKCGLWVAIEMARALPDLGVVITIDEETGCRGARLLREADLSHASVLIQADRRGDRDAVRKTYQGTISGDDWQDHVGSTILAHGYDWCNWGASTDVAALHDTKAAKVSAVNLSAGYHLPHSTSEYIRESHLENCLELSIALAQRSTDRVWAHEMVRSKTFTNTSAGVQGWKRGNDAFSGLRSGALRGTHLRRDWEMGYSHWDPAWQAWRQENGGVASVLGGMTLMIDGEAMASIAEMREVGQHIALLRNKVNDDRPSCERDGCTSDATVLECILASWLCEEHAKEVSITSFVGQQPVIPL